MNINFSKEFFNPNFYHASKCLSDNTLRYCFFYGGSSSSKTYSLVQAVVIATMLDGENTIVFRKVSASIKKTIYNDFKQVISRMKLSEYFDIQHFRIVCSNGAIIDFSGLDNPEKIKGISTYQRLLVDEITELEPEDFKQLRKRMRGIANQKFLATFNPVSDLHWIKQNVYDKLSLKHEKTMLEGNRYSEVYSVERDDSYIFIKSTYLNNYYVVGSPCGTFGYVDEQTIKDFETDKLVDENYYNIYALGDWGRISNGDEFYKNFKREVHVGDFDIDEELPLHISVDENVNPYFPMTIIQTEDDYIKVVDEITGVSPYNNVQSVIKMFAKKYKAFKNSKIFIYGDSTSRRRDARDEKGFNLFGIIITELEKLGFENLETRVPTSNPSVSMSGIFMNRILAGVQSKQILINSTCKETIKDFMYLLEDPDGKIHKQKTRDKETGISYEKYGHTSDSVRYMIIEYMRDEYNKFNNKDSQYTEFDITFDDDIIAF